MNKVKISNHQLVVITTAYVCGASTLFVPSTIAALARQDAWISALITAAAGLLIVWLNSYLGGLYPEKTFIELIQFLMGKWLGGFAAVNFILLSLIAATQFVWYIGDFYISKYMPETPSYAVNILYTAVIAIALLYGLEAIARASEIFYYFFVTVFIITMLMLIPNININYLLPVLENGIQPVVKGTFPVLGLSVFPFILLNMVYPANLTDIKKAKKALFTGYLLGMLITFITVLMCILVLGSSITEVMRFPVFALTREMNIAFVLSRLEAVLVFAWAITILSNAILYFYSGVAGLAQFLKLKDYKVIVLPLGLIVAVFSNIVYSDVAYEINWDTYVWFPYIITFGFILPVILLIISIIRKK